MAGWTNKGKFRVVEHVFNRTPALPTNFYIALCTVATAPTVDINTLGQLTQIADGYGYDATAGGYELDPNSTDFPDIDEDDALDWGDVSVGPGSAVTWSASGGPIPSDSVGARYAVMTDDNATVADREIWYYWDLTSPRIVSDGQDLTLSGGKIQIAES